LCAAIAAKVRHGRRVEWRLRGRRRRRDAHAHTGLGLVARAGVPKSCALNDVHAVLARGALRRLSRAPVGIVAVHEWDLRQAAVLAHPLVGALGLLVVQANPHLVDAGGRHERHDGSIVGGAANVRQTTTHVAAVVARVLPTLDLRDERKAVRWREGRWRGRRW